MNFGVVQASQPILHPQMAIALTVVFSRRVKYLVVCPAGTCVAQRLMHRMILVFR